MDKYTFGKNLYNLRVKNNLTQKDLAKILNVSDKAVSKWETGDAMPRVKTLQMIAECFSVSYETLLSEKIEDNTFPHEEYEQYKNFYDKRLLIETKNTKNRLILTSIFMFLTIISNILGSTMLISNGYMIPTLPRIISLIVLPLALIFAFVLFITSFSKSATFPNLRQHTILYALLASFGILTAIRYLFTEESTTITVIAFCISTLLLTMFVVYAYCKTKNDSYTVSDSALFYLTNYSQYALLLVVLLFEFSIIPFITLLLYCSATQTFLSIYKTEDLINSLNKINRIETKKDNKIKKTIKVVAMCFITFLLALSIAFIIVPGISVKLSLTSLESADKGVVYFNDYDNRFEEEQVQEIVHEHIKIYLPTEYSLEKSEYSYRATTNDKAVLTLMFCEKTEEDIIHDDSYFIFGDNISGSERKTLEKMFLKTFGSFPSTEFEYMKLIHSINPNEINIFDFSQCVIYSTLMIPKELFASSSTLETIIYEREDVCAIITPIKPEYKDTTLYSVSLYPNTDSNYDYTMLLIDSADVLYKVLNSIEIVAQ